MSAVMTQTPRCCTACLVVVPSVDTMGLCAKCAKDFEQWIADTPRDMPVVMILLDRDSDYLKPPLQW